VSSRVVVVGAGLAGMTTARALLAAGFAVTLLEAQPRAGGRVVTLRRPFADGLHVEAGARFVLGDHAAVRGLAHRLGVTLDPLTPPPATHHVTFVRGRRTVSELGATFDLPYAVRDDEQAGVYATYIAPLLERLGDPRAPGWPPPDIAALDHVSLRDLLVQRGASHEAIARAALTSIARIGDGAEHVSALAALRRERLTRDGAARGLLTVRGGTERLTGALAALLGHRIHLGWMAHTIMQDQAGVTVHARRAGEARRYRADYLVCAIPSPLLRAVRVATPWSAAKAAALAALPTSSVVRVYLQCRSPVWQRHGCVADAITDLPIQQVSQVASAADGRSVLEAYVLGPDARALAALDATTRIDFALRAVDRIHPGVAAEFECGASYAWDHAPWARGAFAWFRPGQLTRFSAALGAPEGRIHLAGDHTSPFPGWMEGAISSGERAAREIIARA
jgi:monoamine oxidase